MIAGLDWLPAIICVAVVYVGSTLQASIGIGLGMIAAPVLTLVDTDFVPGAVVLAVIPLTVAVAVADRGHVEHRGVGIALLGRVPGVIIGALVASALSDDLLAILVAVSVLLAVGITLRGRRIEQTDPRLAAAGAASGFTGTTTGVGGPPIALTYQHADPVVMRASLSAFFTVGSLMSVLALMAAGALGTRQFELALLLLPGVLLGVATSRRVTRLLDPWVVRPAVLGICVVSSAGLLVQATT